MKNVTHFFQRLSPGQQLFVVILIIIIFWIARNSIKGWIKGTQKSIENQSEMGALYASGIKATYTKSEYESMAKRLYYAMDGWGTDEEAIFNVFGKLKNDIDFIKLDEAFGTPEATDNTFGLDEEVDMITWIREDLDDADIVKINAKLKKQGVTRRI